MTHPTKTALAVVLVLSFAGSVVLAKEAGQAELKSQATISEATARATALAKVAKGSIASAELEKEHGKLIWSFDISRPKTRNITEIQVDAKTGKIISTQVETPAKEAKEATTEASEKGK